MHQMNYRPITCLLAMFKLLATQIREEIYNLIEYHRLLEEEKSYYKEHLKNI